jgi:hypothetical protein
MNGAREQDVSGQTLYIRKVGTQGRSVLLGTAFKGIARKAIGGVLVHPDALRDVS